MLSSLASTRIGMSMARGIGRAVPRSLANGIVSLAASRFMADPESTLMRASRVNQWVVSGGTLTGEALDGAVRDNVRAMARFLYDLYHTLGNIPAEDALVIRDDTFEQLLERERASGPYVYSGVHFGNFDLVGRALGRAGWRMQLLSVADPNAGYEWQNDYRQDAGFEVTPVSLESLKQAARRLDAGLSVLTGHDRPLLEADKVRPRFFGRPAPMPLLHVRLAMRARVPVIAVAAPRTADGRYRLLTSDPIEMDIGPATPERLALNAERCLAPVEQWITASPEQWAMPHAVWSDVEPPP